MGWFPLAKGLILLFLVAAAATAGTYLARERLGAWAEGRGHSALRKDVRRLEAFLRLPRRWISSLRAPEVPKLVFDIKFKHMQKITRKRNEALARGLLIQEPGDMIPGVIRYGDQTIPVKLRLKGDMTDHLQGNKWSFRVHVGGKDALFGLKRFSVQSPAVRGYHAEILFNETLRHLGVLAPRYFFVDVTVNGRPIGLMALEEHFSKELLEAQGRRESVIVKFDESLLWRFRASKPARIMLDNDMDPFYYYKNAPIDAFSMGKVERTESLNRNYSVAVGLLRAFVEGSLPASEVFDEILMGRFLAVADLWGSDHAQVWHNVRFYFNPISAKLEPIGFNAELQGRLPPRQPCSREENALAPQILRDPKIHRVCMETIRRLSMEIKDGKLLSKLQNVERDHLPALRKEFYLLEGFPWEEMRERADYFLAIMEQGASGAGARATEYPTIVHAYLSKDQENLYLEILNAVPHRVQVRSIRWVPNRTGEPLPVQTAVPVVLPFSLPPTPLRASPQAVRVPIRSLPDVSQFSLEVSASIQDSGRMYSVKAKPYFLPVRRNPIPTSTKEELLARFPFIAEGQGQNALQIRPGRWEVRSTIALPKGYSLTVPAGTTLQFCTKTQGLIARGPLYFQGEKSAPVVLEALSVPGCDGMWQGVTVLEARATSRWSHVTVLNTAGVRLSDWELTGAVTFYKSDVEMSNSYFRNNTAEDFLNLVNSKFRLKDVSFVGTSSDAIDTDFSEGTIEGGFFENIGWAGGGDAIDVSGSRVVVKGVRFLNITDKALSVGEKSVMTASDLVIEGAVTGAASKDGSHLSITDSTIRRARNAGLMAYRKKREFGPGVIDARGVSFAETTVMARAQAGSKITMDGKPVETEDVDVENLYKTIMRPSRRQ